MPTLIKTGAAPFNPISLNPLVWLDPTGNATYSGSTLVTASNAGTAGGSFSIVGTLSKGAQGSLTPLVISNIANRLTFSMPAINTGALSVFYAGSLISAAINGIIGMDWPGGTGAKACYADVGAGDSYGFGYGCCDPAVNAPAFYSATGGVGDTSFHTMTWQFGTSVGLWKDNASQTLTQQAAGAMTNTLSQTWEFGCADTATETANANVSTIIIFDYLLDNTQRTNLHNYYVALS